MKHFASAGDGFPLYNDITSLTPNVDDIAVSLHDSASSLLPFPGPYLLEHYLLHKARSLFPAARVPRHPVLMLDHYINLGPDVFVAFAKSNELESGSFLSQEKSEGILFGGLVLYLCEGRVPSQQLSWLRFVPGACLCLVTHSCRGLLNEVGRLELEEQWRVRLRDEYKTACPDNVFKPLFFLLGYYGK